MGVLEDLGGYLDAQTASLTAGTNLFYGLLPDTPNVCVSLYENAGASPVSTMGSDNLPKLERPQLQVFVRHTSYSTGRDLADTVYRILTQIANATINSNSYLRVEAISSFSDLQRDDNRRVLFVSNFDVVRITP